MMKIQKKNNKNLLKYVKLKKNQKISLHQLENKKL